VNIPAKFEVRSFTRSWDNRGYSKKLGSQWVRPCSLFSQIFNGLFFAWTLWIYLPNLKFVALPVSEITGVLKKIGPSLDTPTLPFLQNFSWACFRMDTVNIPAKFEVPSFSRSWDNSDCSFMRRVANPQSRGRGGHRGQGWYRSKERLWLPIALHSNFSCIFTCFRDIAAFVL